MKYTEKATDTVDKLILMMVIARRLTSEMPVMPGVEFVGFTTARPQWGWPDIREKS